MICANLYTYFRTDIEQTFSTDDVSPLSIVKCSMQWIASHEHNVPVQSHVYVCMYVCSSSSSSSSSSSLPNKNKDKTKMKEREYRTF